ncbi:MAG: hypothetical protein HY063_10910 [Bacteroidetes bacterium]|nr:hypothetical protein [Bacteroidota bacterium]
MTRWTALLFATAFLLFGQQSNGQTNELKNNSAFVELLGNGGSFFSINYERLFHYKKVPLLHNSLRLGFAFGSNKYDNTTIYNFPIEINTLIGRQKHFIEIGFGLTAFHGTSNLNDTLLPIGERTNFWDTYLLRVGYRYMGDGVVFRVAPLLGFVNIKTQSTKRELVLGFGISIGGVFNFKKSKPSETN